MSLSLPASPVGSTRRYRGSYSAHTHAYVQVLFGLHGTLELEVEGRMACVEAHTGLVVPPGARHAFHSRRSARLWVVDAPPQCGLERLRAFRLPNSWSADDDVVHTLGQIATAARVLQRRSVDPAVLAEAVDACLWQDWPIARMAAVFLLSSPQFHSRWRAVSDDTPQAWLRQRRLDRAERLLRAGHGVEAVAWQVGYRSASALCVALRRERGIGARDLRGHRGARAERAAQ